MVTSKTELFNLALSKIGASQITSPEDGSKKALSCNTYYDHVRDEVLRFFPFSCAKKTISLAPIESGVFQLPNDCLYIVSVAEGKPYEKIGNTLEIFSDTCTLTYIQKITDVTKFDTHVVEAIISLLASKIALDISGNQQIEANRFQEYQLKLQQAVISESKEVKAGTMRTTKRWDEV